MAGVVSPSASEVHTDIASPFNVFLSLLLPAILLYYVYWRLSRRSMLKLAEKIPGPPGLPIIGNALDFLGSSHSEFGFVFIFIIFCLYKQINLMNSVNFVSFRKIKWGTLISSQHIIDISP